MRRAWLAFAVMVPTGALVFWWALGDADVPPEVEVRSSPTPSAALEAPPPPRSLASPAAVAPEAPDASAPVAVAERLADLDAGSFTVVTPAPPAPTDAGLTADVAAPAVGFDAGAGAPDDPRFTVRWGKEGLCGDEPLARLAARRDALLATFVGVRRANTLILRDPDVPIEFADGVGDALTSARQIVLGLLGPRADVAPPLVYLYASADQLRGVACVNTATAGYYDGAIHLPASDPDAYRTVVHEQVHHVLNTLGVRKPMWLHEGLAMYAADERWWQDPRLGLMAWLRARHLPFPALTEAFPHTADELFAGAAYYQSFQMVSFVGQRAGQPDFFWLVEGLASGRFTPQACFGQSVGLTGEPLELAWSAFMQSR